jgi:hypothetical protein
MTTVATLAISLQTLFTTTATLCGQLAGLIRRERTLTAQAFAQALVFGWSAQPTATLESFAPALGLSAQALHQRMGPAARAFFEALLTAALQHIQQARRSRCVLLQSFAAVIIDDTTTVALPADMAHQFPGSGGCAGNAAAVKILLRWELLTGRLLALRWLPGVTSDRTLAATADELPPGALHLADQGFFDAGRWQSLTDEQFWISRVPANITVAVDQPWQGLTDWLRTLTTDFDGAVQLVQSQQLACRLVARRCPPEVAARRRQKLREQLRRKKNRTPSRRQLVLCDWLVLASNVPATRLSAQALWLVYRSRWQIELLFKRAKQQLGLSFSHGRTGERVLVEVLAKLLACVVVHWQSLLRAGPLGGVSVVLLFRLVQAYAGRLWDRLRDGLPLESVLERLRQELERVRRQPHRCKQPSTRELLNHTELVRSLGSYGADAHRSPRHHFVAAFALES